MAEEVTKSEQYTVGSSQPPHSLTVIPAAHNDSGAPRQQHARNDAAMREPELVSQRGRTLKRHSPLRLSHWRVFCPPNSRQDCSVCDEGDAVARSHEVSQVSLVHDALRVLVVVNEGNREPHA